jgi:hypothetical protein
VFVLRCSGLFFGTSELEIIAAAAAIRRAGESACGRENKDYNLALVAFHTWIVYQVHTHGGPPSPPNVMMEMCAAAQVTRNDAWWRHIELEKGVYNFTEMDSWVAKVNSSTGSACAAGQPMLQHFILEGGNHLYTGKDSTAPTTREEVAAFTRFAVAIMSHYAGMGILWEVYN